MSLNLYEKKIADAFKEYTNIPNEIPFFDNSKLMGLKYENDIMVKSGNATKRQKKLWFDFLQK